MKKETPVEGISESNQKVKKQNLEKFVLHLYVAGSSTKSMWAISNIKNICEEFLNGRYELKVIDIYQNTKLSQKENIVTVPTLIKKKPLPEKKIIGDLSEKKKVLIELGIKIK